MCLVFTNPIKHPIHYKVTVSNDGNNSDLCMALSNLSGVDSSKMFATDVYNHRFHKIYAPEEAVGKIHDRDNIVV